MKKLEQRRTRRQPSSVQPVQPKLFVGDDREPGEFPHACDFDRVCEDDTPPVVLYIDEGVADRNRDDVAKVG